MDMFWWMIVGVVTLALVALVTALYMWKLYKDFPDVMKAKVVSAEKWPINEYISGYKYHFKGRNKGNRMMTDYVTYREKKFKTGEKITVRMSKDGQTCHSNFPLWPAATSAICILMSFVLIFVYVSNNRTQENNTVLQETGYYIVTDTDVLFQGDTLGLVKIEGGAHAVSTGDYGFVFYQGVPHYESENTDLMCIHSMGTSVFVDGTVDALDATLLEKVSDMGYTVNTVATVYDNGTNTEAEPHDHVHDEENIDETQDIVSTNPETITDSAETSSNGTEELITEPTNN